MDMGIHMVVMAGAVEAGGKPFHCFAIYTDPRFQAGIFFGTISCNAEND